LQFLASRGYPTTGFDAAITGWLNERLGLSLAPGYFDLLFGNVPGSIGEVSALLLILGGVYLLVRKIITWEIPTAYMVSFGLLVWVFGGLRFGNGLFRGDAVFHLLSRRPDARAPSTWPRTW
jgi:Na+-translocating ferredoxin:NAD+ oxidoreductase subunit D